MLADKDLELGSEAAGKNHQSDKKNRSKQQFDLERLAPFAADVADKISTGGQRKQKHPGHEQRSGMKNYSPRQMHVDGPCGVPGGRDGHERENQRVSYATRRPDVGIETTIQQRIGVEKQIEAKHTGKSEA